MPTTSLRGHWLFLLSEPEAIALCLGAADVLPCTPMAMPRAVAGESTPHPGAQDSDDTRVVTLR